MDGKDRKGKTVTSDSKQILDLRSRSFYYRFYSRLQSFLIYSPGSSLKDFRNFLSGL